MTMFPGCQVRYLWVIVQKHREIILSHLFEYFTQSTAMPPWTCLIFCENFMSSCFYAFDLVYKSISIFYWILFACDLQGIKESLWNCWPKRKSERNNFTGSCKLKTWWDTDSQLLVRTSISPCVSPPACSSASHSGWLSPPHSSKDGLQRLQGAIICMSGISEHEWFSASIHMAVLALVICSPRLSPGSED